jgi:putative transposase
MKRSYCHIYLHLIWSTKNWEPLINETMERDIYEIFDAKAKKHNSGIIAIGNTNDHIHVLVRISSRTVISEMIREFKGSTSYFINQNGGSLYWQDGYGVVSVSLSAVDTVKNYVENQKTKHAAKEIVKQLEMVEDEG